MPLSSAPQIPLADLNPRVRVRRQQQPGRGQAIGGGPLSPKGSPWLHGLEQVSWGGEADPGAQYLPSFTMRIRSL